MVELEIKDHHLYATAIDGAQIPRQTHCKYGHEYTPENTGINGGTRRCNKCNALAARQWRERKKQRA
jgi:hypothetical protein